MFATTLPQPGVRTLAGLVFDRLGRMPVVGDRAVIDGVTLFGARGGGTRITALRVTLPRDAAQTAPSP